MARGRVRRRLVFFLPGFDPNPPRRYRELFRREAPRQAAIAGYALEMLPGAGPDRWQARFAEDGAATLTEFRLLDWSDLVRPEMATGWRVLAGRSLRILRAYLGSGTAGRLWRLRRGPVLACLWPIAVLMLRALLLALFAAAACRILGLWTGLALSALAIWAEARLFARADRRLYVSYLLADIHYWCRDGGAMDPQLSARLDGFAAEIAAAEGEADEMLLIGHSSGAGLAVSLAARLPRAARPALLTLGQSVPMVALLPGAEELRRDLAEVAAGGTPWVDVTAPGDPCCFALCDPAATEGAGPGPLILSAAYSRSLSAATLKAMRLRFFRRHHQYLCAFDDPSGFDYFRTACGPQTLAETFAGRGNSPGRRGAEAGG
ncbi:hypothetical protein [Poseidonocella sp. HB161398]|uniref:hypothetical protein n=1 Tax=Poseidonocella sp. HB161398 TaxID=2320855 RepID=UPI001107B3EB|nr:hypothetical protein [Poseidonocella sp. HB161398]